MKQAKPVAIMRTEKDVENFLDYAGYGPYHYGDWRALKNRDQSVASAFQREALQK